MSEISSHSLRTITVLVKNVKLALYQLISCHHWLTAFLLFLVLSNLTNYLSDLGWPQGWPMSFQGWILESPLGSIFSLLKTLVKATTKNGYLCLKKSIMN